MDSIIEVYGDAIQTIIAIIISIGMIFFNLGYLSTYINNVLQVVI